MISWDEDHLLHTAVAGITMIGRLVMYSRTPARELVNLAWSNKCEDAKPLDHGRSAAFGGPLRALSMLV